MPTFVRQALAGEPITVFGDGALLRHVKEVVQAFFLLMKLDDLFGEVYKGSYSGQVLHDLAHVALKGRDVLIPELLLLLDKVQHPSPRLYLLRITAILNTAF